LPVVGWHTPRPHGLQIFSHVVPQRSGGHDKIRSSVNNVLVVVVVKISVDDRLNNMMSGVEIVDRDGIRVVVFDIFIIL